MHWITTTAWCGPGPTGQIRQQSHVIYLAGVCRGPQTWQQKSDGSNWLSPATKFPYPWGAAWARQHARSVHGGGPGPIQGYRVSSTGFPSSWRWGGFQSCTLGLKEALWSLIQLAEQPQVTHSACASKRCRQLYW